ATTGGPSATPSGASQTGTSGSESPSGPPPRPPPIEAPPSSPFSLVPHDLGDPKEMETPRPPRRAPASEPPPPNVPQAPPPPREFSHPSMSAQMASARSSRSGGISTVPPGPPRP